MVQWTISRAERAEHKRRAGISISADDARIHGRSLKLAAFATFAGPLDLLTCFAGRGSQHARRTQGAKDPRDKD
jgi:hypothetical protein